MKIFFNSLVPVFLIFTLLPDKGMLIRYINQTPPNIDLKAGQSAVFFCSVSEDLGMKEIHFRKQGTQILNLTIQSSDISSKVKFTGTFEKFKWIIDEESKNENIASYICTDQTGRLNKINQIDCPSPDESSTYMFLKNKDKEVVSLWVNPRAYHSRLDISGTIWNLEITLGNLSKEDIDSYTCTGRADGIGEELKGTHTFLNVKSHGICIHIGQLGLAFAMALASCLIKSY